MKRKLTLLFYFSLLPHLLWAQYFIALNDSNVFHYDNLYLIDIPLNHSGNLFIQDSDSLIPIYIYHKIWADSHIAGNRDDEGYVYFNFDTVFISHKQVVWNSDLDVTAIKHSIVPLFFGDYGSLQPDDTLKNINNRFKAYKQLYKTTTDTNKVFIYYAEQHGSHCCPPDTYYANKIPIEDFIKAFEKKNNVKVGESFWVSEGIEGEHSDYYTLSGLTGLQKLQFISERYQSLEPGNPKILHVYTPRIFSLNFLKRTWFRNTSYKEDYDPDRVYGSVDSKPEYPGGEDGFLKLFDRLRQNGVYGKTTITFVVRKDGSLSDIKVVREGSPKVNRQIKNVVNNCPKWKPGKIDGKPVNTYYTFTSIF